MKFLKNKRFKTIVITKKNILLFVCSAILISFIIFAAVRKDTQIPAEQYTSSEDFHNIILSSELHTDSDIKSSIKSAVNKLLGFDLSKPETILSDYSSEFDESDKGINPEDVVYPQAPEKSSAPVESEPPKAEEKPIQEVTVAKGLSVSNSADIAVDPQALAADNLCFSLDSDGPQILIVHTHTTESYTDSGKTKYTVTDSDRSTNEQENIIAVGNALCEVLEQRGISVIHDATVHDYPSYNGAYNRSKATVLANLEKYPTIKIVLDVHRDGIVRSDGTKIKVASDINGIKTAQCMFVVGSNAELTHDKWKENMKLACKLQNKANELYPNLMRPINLRAERFNQQLSTGALIIEIGSNGNTLEEAVTGAKCMGDVIASLFGF